MDNPATPRSESTSYDLFLRPGDKRTFWGMADRGIRLNRDGIAWTTDGQESRAPFTNIAEVHLQTGNVGKEVIATCRIRFVDSTLLTIASSNSEGVEDDAQASLYADFVHDLHARLAALKNVSIAFTAGFSETRYRLGKALLVTAALFFIATPAFLTLVTGQLKALSLFIGGVVLAWPLYKLMQANAPRSYDPQDVPEDLVQTKPLVQQWLSWIQN